MRHDPSRLLCGQWRPIARKDPRAQFQGAYGTATVMFLPVQAPLDTDRSRRTVVCRCTAQDAMIARPFRLNSRYIKIKTTYFMTQRFALSRHKEAMQLLFKGLKVLDRLGGCSALTQKILELIHGARVTGQQVTALQCLHGDSPLV